MLFSGKKQASWPKHFKWAHTVFVWRHIWVMEDLLPFTESGTLRRMQSLLSSTCGWGQTQRHYGIVM